MTTLAAPSLRLWPGVALVSLLFLLRYLLPLLAPDALLYGLLGGLACAPALILWWLFFSRAPRPERFGAVPLAIAAVYLASRFTHVSIATGAQGLLLVILSTPFLCLAFVGWAALSRPLSPALRWASLLAALFLSLLPWTLLRTGGLDSGFTNELTWRWAPTPEDRLLAAAPALPLPLPPPPAAEPKSPDPVKSAPPPLPTPIWPGFRGPARDGAVSSPAILTDWSAHPPAELWRRPIGPGWSSFSVAGDLFFTQEQRGDDELVSCYSLSSGKPVWIHKDRARFWESNAGAGPRATPTLHNGRVFTHGATGIVNALDARTGATLWSRNAATDSGAKLPEWGFSSSPLVLGDSLIVAASGTLVAYQLDSGKLLWKTPSAGVSYSSPAPATLSGIPQILLASSQGLSSYNPATGAQLWQHLWKGYPIVQPALTPDGDILLSVSESSGLRRLSAKPGPSSWTIEERWTSNGLKPYFNDFAVHKGHAYGFDGRILSCIDLASGQRKWKGGRYGQGQFLLLPAQDALLVLSEEGELALVSAVPEQFTELARRPAIEGKTWNHPVLAGDVLLVRNGQEMAAFRLLR